MQLSINMVFGYIIGVMVLGYIIYVIGLGYIKSVIIVKLHSKCHGLGYIIGDVDLILYNRYY